MHNLYGKRRLNIFEIKGSFTLSNGMFCYWGKSKEEGLGVDIYDDFTKKLLVGMEHNIIASEDDDMALSSMLKSIMESMLDELEDSMVYYYGAHEGTFEKENITIPAPPKTGRFAV